MSLYSTALAGVLTTTLAAAAAPASAQVGAPSASPATSERTPQDPWEDANRKSFLVGGAIDTILVRPAAVLYQRLTPRPARDGVRNVTSNLGEPVIIINRVLQLRPDLAVVALSRLTVNSTLGVAGLFDVATGAGLAKKGTNFGQTLSRYGVRAGPYLFIPVLGPSTVRDAAGRAVDAALDPFFWIRFRDDGYFLGARAALAALDARSRADPALQDLKRTATDPYASLRSAYLQNADFLDHGGKLDVQSLPDFGPEPAAPTSTPAAPTPHPQD